MRAVAVSNGTSSPQGTNLQHFGNPIFAEALPYSAIYEFFNYLAST
jgi:hypothetical protein